MPALHFPSVVLLGAAVAALLTLVCLVLIPTLSDRRVTRNLSIANLCFTAVLVSRFVSGDSPPAWAYGTFWGLLVVCSAFEWYAIESLQRPTDGLLRRRAAMLCGLLGAIAVSLWAMPGPQLAGLITGLGTTAYYLLGAHATLRLDGAHLAIPRRVLAGALATSALFAAMHVAQRAADLLAGRVEVQATAVTWFGAILLFCTVNVGVLLLLYLRLAEQVQRLAQTDELTGALNRRGFGLRTTALRERRQAGALVLVDIDRFKSINDGHGHAVGDEVLRWFAATLRRFMRHDDVLARMGGEEFCLLLPGLDAAQAMAVAERIRVEFERHDVAPTRAGALRITASFGVSVFDPDDPVPDARLREADEALYAAKRGGRNRVVRWAPSLVQVVPV